MLSATLPVAVALAVIYLLAGTAGLLKPLLFPWDGLGFLAFCLLAWALRRRQEGERGVAMAASWLVAAVNIVAALNSQVYGIQHPVTTLYLPGIILAGILIGGWFLPLWTAFGALFILGWGLLDLWGLEDPLRIPLSGPAELVSTVALWWGLLALTGWLVWLFARNLERAVQLSRGQTAALTQILDTLRHTTTLDVILRRVLETVAGQLAAGNVSLFLYEPAGEQVRLHLSYGETPAGNVPDGTRPVPATTDPLWQALLESGDAVVLDDPSLTQGDQTMLLVPLKLGEAISGYMRITTREEQRFGREDMELAAALAQLATLALQLTDLARQLQEAAITGERNRMAQEIHDTLAQGLTGIIIQLEAAEDVVAEEPAAVQVHLERARLLARESLAEARRSVWALRPQALEEMDLPGALQGLAARRQDGRGPVIRVQVADVPYALPALVENELFRIAQEALHNALKHAAASAVQIQLSYQPTAVELRVVDNGQGFDVTQPAQGFGLVSMRERAARSGAELTIDSSLEGTTVACVLPVNQQTHP